MTNAGKQVPRVAVIIPTYNRWSYVRDAVESCLAQSHPHIEVVVVDDASTDGTSRKLSTRFGKKVTLVTLPENVQKSCARNTGIRSCDADFICMLDSDDLLLPHAVANRLAVFTEDPTFNGVAYGSARYAGRHRHIDHDAFPSGDILDAYLANFDILNNNAFLMRRSAMLEHGMYRESLTNMEDRDLLIRLAARLPFRYCGAVVQTVRRVKGSARFCYRDVLRQGRALTDGLKKDDALAAVLGERIRFVEVMERCELLRAQYKLKLYRDFLRDARTLLSAFPDQVPCDMRMRRRVFTARVLQHIVRPSAEPPMACQ